jgi:putative aminopeptidase FrvX
MTPEPTMQVPRIGSAQLKLLEILTNACAVSGDEGEVRKIVLDEVRPVADDVKIDHLGNVLVIKNGKGKARLRVMLAAHMDEVGFMLIQNEDKEDGIYRFDVVGGVSTSHLAGQSILIGKEHVPGVIGAKPVHMTTNEELKNALTLESLRIDVGPGNSHLVKPGDRATYATRFSRVGPSLRAKALDDRLGICTLIELVKQAPPNIDLLAAFTVQEEVGLRGAKVAAYALEPDLAIALDSTPANDLPTWDDSENTRYNTRLGYGPAIYTADAATLSDPRLIRHLAETAEEAKIPYQLRQPGGGGTDAGAIHKQRAGIPSVSVSVPGRYLHTPVSLARLSDWKNTLALVHLALQRLSPDILHAER